MSFDRETRRRAIRRFRLLGLAAAMVLASLSFASAATYYWSGISDDWSTAAKWGGTEPTADDDAYIINGGTATISLPGETCSGLFLGGVNTGTVEMTGGALSVYAESVGHSGTGV